MRRDMIRASRPSGTHSKLVEHTEGKGHFELHLVIQVIGVISFKVVYLIFSSIFYFFSQPLLRVGVCPELA